MKISRRTAIRMLDEPIGSEISDRDLGSMLKAKGLLQIGPNKIVGPYIIEHGYGAPIPKYVHDYEDDYEDDFQDDLDEDDVWKVIRRG